MKHFYLLVVLLLLIPIFSFAQSNYKPGYIVNMQGDTTKGYVDFKEWTINPTKFSFKININGSASIYTISNAKAFGINGYEYYQQYNVTVSQAKTDIEKITNDIDTITIAGTYFLKTVTRGNKLNLFVYDDGERPHLYVAENNNNPVELLIRCYLDPQESSKIITQYIYRRQLQGWAYTYKDDDEKLKEKIALTDYDERQIEAIVAAINGSGSQPLKQYNKSSSSTRFIVGAGAISLGTKFIGNSEFVGQTHTAIFPTVTAGVDFFSNKNVGDLIFRMELGLSGNKANFMQTIAGQTATPYISTLGFNQYIISFNPQILYNFYNTAAAKVYFAIGATLNYSTYSNKYYIVYPGNGFAPEANEFPDVQSFFSTLSGKIGYVINSKVGIYIGYYPSAPISDNSGYHLSITQYKLGVNYLFN